MSSPPTTLGKYQIIREIARSNDIVYEAYDPLMNRRVAIKELAVPNGSTPQQKEERLKRFLREAKAAGSLAHPNIVTIYEVGEDGGRHYLVMEYLDGHTLRNELDARGFLPADEACKIAEAVLRGLEYAHQNGVIHRDIKPENIQMLTDGRIKLTDFGIARLTFEPNLTMDGQVFGTPSYMSPEQVVGKEIDVRSDIFSLGIVLYEMLAGQKPFGGDSVVTITYAIMNKTPDRPGQASPPIWGVVAKALDKTPALRYPNASEMLRSLEAAEQASKNITSGIPPAQPYLGQTQIPTSNPFLPNVPYPGGSYMSTSAPPPIQYPYSPYQQGQGAPPVAPANSNPYAPHLQPYIPGQTYLPSQAPYNPNQQTYAPMLQNIPVYYPPPPRRPLMNTEQRALMWRIVGVFLVLGAIFAGLVVFLLTQSSSLQPQDNKAPASQYVNPSDQSNIDQSDEGASLNPSGSESAGLELAKQAGDEYGQEASIQDFENAVPKLESAAEGYSNASDANDARRCYDEAAAARYNWARLVEGNDRESARQILYGARKEVTPDTSLSSLITTELDRLT